MSKHRALKPTLPCPCCGAPRRGYAGADLRAVREAAEVAVRELARRSGVSSTHLSDVELGRRRATPAVVAAYEGLR
jgi:DNA-binding transcriptional regulator YiaG